MFILPSKNWSGPEYIELLHKPRELLPCKHPSELPFVIIAVDFNYPLIYWFSLSSNDTSSSHLLDIFNDFHLQQFVAAPTWFGASTSSLLDLVFSSLPAGIDKCYCEFSDHCLAYFDIAILLVTSDKSPCKIYMYGRGNYDQLHCFVCFKHTNWRLNGWMLRS